MLNRRLIRIKVFKVLYSTIFSGRDSIKSAEKELTLSCEHTRDLYFFILNLSIALVRVAENKMELGFKKFQPTPEEVNPNRRFVENSFTADIIAKEEFLDYCEKHGLLWNGDFLLFVKNLYARIVETDYFKDYMSAEESSSEQDYELFLNIFEQELEDDEDLEEILQERSLYWMDDLEYVINVITRNIKTLKSRIGTKFPSVFMKDDDREFAFDLLNQSIMNHSKYQDVIKENLSNWDSERVVATDMILISMGISEATHFSNIPIKVTINEYVEISKFYSTANSKVFVNGLLDRIIQKMVLEGEIVKAGRGLIDS